MLTILLGAIASVSWFISVLASFCVLRKLKERPPQLQNPFAISVLKPLKGVDAGLYENLSALAKQRYAPFELLFGAEDKNDPALEVARQVQRDFPDVPIRVVAGTSFQGLNPKVRMLRQLAEHASADWLLVSDSNVRPGPFYLRDIAACQERSGADLVHNLLRGEGQESFGARLESLQMNTWVAASIAFCDAGKHACVIGKSMLLRRSALEEVGGFSSVQDILAEDYILGSRMSQAGHKVVLSSHVLPVIHGARDGASFFNRHIRWGQMRRWIAPGFYVAELLVNPLPWLALLAWLGGPLVFAGALVALAMKWLVDALVYYKLSGELPVRTVVLLPLKDLLQPGIWAVGAFKVRIRWRGNQMRIGPGSRLFPVKSLDDEASPVSEESSLDAKPQEAW